MPAQHFDWIRIRLIATVFALFLYRFSQVCPQRLPNLANETAALDRMPRGRLEYLKRLMPHLQNQSEDCLYLNIYVPIQGKLSSTIYFVCVVLFVSDHECGANSIAPSISATAMKCCYYVKRFLFITWSLINAHLLQLDTPRRHDNNNNWDKRRLQKFLHVLGADI